MDYYSKLGLAIELQTAELSQQALKIQLTSQSGYNVLLNLLGRNFASQFFKPSLIRCSNLMRQRDGIFA